MIIDPERHELDALLPRFPPSCRVIEIGCGDGRLTRRYTERVASVLAIDPDQAAIADFRGTGVPSNVEVRTLSIDRLELPACSTDVVLFSWSL